MGPVSVPSSRKICTFKTSFRTLLPNQILHHFQVAIYTQLLFAQRIHSLQTCFLCLDNLQYHIPSNNHRRLRVYFHYQVANKWYRPQQKIIKIISS